MTRLSHQELSLLLYALEGVKSATGANFAAEPSCEEACPIVDHLEEMFGKLSPEKRLVGHLNNHLREGMLECGFLEVMNKIKASDPQTLTMDDQIKVQQVQERLKTWSCEIKFEDDERELLRQAFSRFPRAAWISMPRTLWRLRKKIRLR